MEQGGAFGPRVPVISTLRDRHKSKYFPDGHLSMMIVGKTGCGKSFLLRELIPQIAHLSQIIMCTKIQGNPVCAAIKKYCENTPIDVRIAVPGETAIGLGDPLTPQAQSSQSPGKMTEQAIMASLSSLGRGAPSTHATGNGMIEYSEASDPDEAARIIEMKTQSKPTGTSGLVIFDDFNQSTTSRNDPFMRVHNQVASMMRNYGYHTICVTQTPTNISTLVRNNVNMSFFFNMDDIHSIRAAKLLFRTMTGREDEEFDDLFGLIKKHRYSYMLLISDSDKQGMFINIPGETDGLEEICTRKEIDEEDIRNDTHLQSIIERLLALEEERDDESGAKKSVIAYKISRVRSELTEYLRYLANACHVPLPDLTALVSSMYKL